MIREDYLDGQYDAHNFPEKHLDAYWVFIELVSYDEQFKKDKYGFRTVLNAACNIQTIDMSTIEKYLYENLTIDIWNREAEDYTP